MKTEQEIKDEIARLEEVLEKARNCGFPMSAEQACLHGKIIALKWALDGKEE